MKISNLRPGMEHVNIKVILMELERPRKVETNYGITHTLVEGKVEDESGSMGITVWNDKIDLLERVIIGDHIELKNCFITSFKGELSINVGRDSDIIKMEKKVHVNTSHAKKMSEETKSFIGPKKNLL